MPRTKVRENFSLPFLRIFLSFLFFVISAFCFAALRLLAEYPIQAIDLPLKQTVYFFSFMKAKDHNRTYPKVLL